MSTVWKAVIPAGKKSVKQEIKMEALPRELALRIALASRILPDRHSQTVGNIT
jgi:hypothetical protein